MSHKSAAPWGALVLLALANPAWAQNGVVRDSVGATAGGRGGTNVAFADNGSILLDNPAGMVNVAGGGLFEVSADGLITSVHYSDPLNSGLNKFRPEGLPALSYIEKSADGKWAYGLGLYAPAGFGAEYGLTNRVFGPQQLESFGALGKLLPGLAYRLTDRLTVGGTFGLGISTADFEGPISLQNGLVRGAPALIHLHGTDVAPVWSAGFQYQLTDSTVIGLAYTDESRFDLKGTMDGAVAGVGPGLVYSKFDSNLHLVWPRSLVFGVKQDLSDCQRLSLDVGWYNWSSAFSGLDLRLTNASNPLIGGLLGPTIRQTFPLSWKDAVSVRVGYEYFLTPCDVLRVGYIYDSPAADVATLTPYIPGILQHTFTVGYGKKWTNWDFNIAYQFCFGPKEAVGQSALAGGDFSDSQLRAQVHFLMVSFGYHF